MLHVCGVWGAALEREDRNTDLATVEASRSRVADWKHISAPRLRWRFVQLWSLRLRAPRAQWKKNEDNSPSQCLSTLIVVEVSVTVAESKATCAQHRRQHHCLIGPRRLSDSYPRCSKRPIKAPECAGVSDDLS